MIPEWSGWLLYVILKARKLAQILEICKPPPNVLGTTIVSALSGRQHVNKPLDAVYSCVKEAALVEHYNCLERNKWSGKNAGLEWRAGVETDKPVSR